MKNFMQSLRHGLVRSLEVFLIGAFMLLTFDVLWGVFTRYVLNDQAGWTEELATYLLVWVSLLGAALTYEAHGHLGVDYIVGLFDPPARRLSAIFVELVVLGFSIGVLIIGGWILVFETLAQGQVSPSLGLKVGFLYFAAPVSGVFFTLFALEHLYELIRGETLDATASVETPIR